MSEVEELRALCEAWGVEALYGLGSRASEMRDLVFEEGKGVFPGTSDVDIGVKFRPGSRASVKDKVRVAIGFEDLLGVNRVDLCVIEEVDPFVAAEVVRGEKPYCKDDVIGDEYELYVLRRAGDFTFLERERMKLVLEE